MAKDIKVTLTLDNRAFNRNVQQSQRQVKTFETNSVGSLKAVGTAFAAVFSAKLLSDIVKTGQTFQDLRLSLNFVAGSADEGAKAFDNLTQLATQTQFGVEELVQTFIRLKGAGIEPTNDLLLTFADTASLAQDQLGVLTSLTELFARGATKGKLELEDFNKIAERGVDIFKPLTKEFGLSIQEIQKLAQTAEGQEQLFRGIEKALDDTYGGALQEKLKSSSVAFSNLRIASRRLQDAIFTAFGLDSTEAIDGLTDAVNQLATNIQNLNFNEIASQLERLATVGLALTMVFGASGLIRVFGSIQAGAIALGLKLGNLGKNMFSLRAITNNLTRAKARFSDVVTGLGKGGRIGSLGGGIANLGKAFSRFIPFVGTALLGLEGLSFISKKLGGPDFMAGFNDLVVDGAKNLLGFNDALEETQDIANGFVGPLLPDGSTGTTPVDDDDDGTPKPKSLATLRQFIEDFESKLGSLKRTEEEYNRVVEEFKTQFANELPAALVGTNAALTLFDEGMKDIDKAFDRQAPKAKVVKTLLQQYQDMLAKVIPTQTTFEDELTKLNDLFGNPETVEQIQEYETALDRLRDAFGIDEEVQAFLDTFDDVDTLEEFNQKMIVLQSLLDQNKISAKEFEDAVKDLQNTLGEDEIFANFIDDLNTGVKTLSEDLVDAFEKGESAGDVFKNFFKNMIKQIIADIIRLMVFLPILQAFGFQVSGGSITGFSNPFKATGAGGGQVMARRPMLVGEQGPELFVPSNSGSLTPNHQMGTQVTYNINAVDAPSFQQLVASDPQFIYAVTQTGARTIPGSR
jgi:tape measure domain-containing protein